MHLSSPCVDGLLIRDVAPGDGAACARLWTSFGTALAERMPGRFRAPDAEGLAEWFEGEIASTGPGVLRALALASGEPVGLAHAVLRSPSDPSGATILIDALATRVILEDLVVVESARTRGVGSALVRHAEEWGRSHGARRMTLHSDPEGPMRAFYERLGYTISAATYDKRLS